MSGKLLKGRYRILSTLGAGGFSSTFIAEDCDLPDHPHCVVKQLKVSDENVAQIAQRLFLSEAKSLQMLGNHDQIPQLLAYFTEDQDSVDRKDWNSI